MHRHSTAAAPCLRYDARNRVIVPCSGDGAALGSMDRTIRFKYRRRPWRVYLAVALFMTVAAAGGALGWFGLFREQGTQTMAAPRPAVQTVIMRGSGSGASTALATNQVHVLDGDTIRIAGAPDHRLVGCDAPETVNAQCQSERVLGERATNRLRSIVAGGGITLERVACSCPPGTEGQQSCNCARRCGILRAHGKNVCDTLIAERIARPFVCGQTRCPPRQS